MACAIEDAGFKIRDQIQWLYGVGFPKSLDVSKAIDRANGDERKVKKIIKMTGKAVGIYGEMAGNNAETYPASAASAAWAGWGTALKPAHEPICLARKPLSEKTVAANVLKWGVGALNIDASRIKGNDSQLKEKYDSVQNAGPRSNSVYGKDDRDRAGAKPHEAGRFPANIILDEEAARMLDEQSGGSVSRIGSPRSGNSGDGWGMTATGSEYSDSGGASRFFYCAKPSQRERNIGLDGEVGRKRDDGRKEGNPGGDNPRNRGVKEVKNFHPTVKPVSLISYLIRLVTPESGIVLDPFIGSGTTGIAAASLGFDFVGLEISEDYAQIARNRIESETRKGGFLF